MTTTDQPISRDDIEAKFVELQKGVEEATSSVKDYGTKIGIAGGIMLLILVFVLGRKRGKQNRTMVEIRRL